ncbi:esterase/lipase family protein [Luteimonas sp. e5]
MPSRDDRQPVLLLHGLWMHAPAMHWFASRLREQGFAPQPFGYYSLLQDTDATVDKLAATFAAEPGIPVVAHSLGGLLAVRAAERAGAAAPSRIVCLGSPLAGSAAARGMSERIPAGEHLLGRHRPLLLQGVPRLPRDLEVGMVAGCTPLGLGHFMAGFDCEHDGTVAVDETRVPGLADHIVLPASHSGLIFSRDAVEQAVRFLRHGRFLHPDAQRAAAAAQRPIA